MDSSTLLFVAGVLLLTLFLLAILYLLYRYLISETPYQRTRLIDQIDSKLNEKKTVKKGKGSLRQRNVAKGGDDGAKKSEEGKVEKTDVEKVAKDMKKKADKGKGKKETEDSGEIAKVASTSHPVTKSASEVKSTEGSNSKPTTKASSLSRKGEGSGEDGVRGEKKKKEVVDERKEVVEEVMEAKKVIGLQANQSDASIKSTNGKTALKLQQQQEMLQKQEQQQVIQQQQVKQIVQQQQQQQVVHQQQQQKQPQVLQQQQQVVQQQQQVAQQQQSATKKKNKRQNDADNELVAGLIQQQEEQQQKQKQQLQQQQLKQQQQQQQLKQQQQQLKQQQQQHKFEDPSMVEDLKRMVASKEAQLQREIQQRSTLNEEYTRVREELEKEKTRAAMVMTKKQTEEKQALMARMNQAQQLNKQTVQQLQQELATAKNNANNSNIIMANLAEENAKMKAKFSHTDKMNEENTKTIEVLKASLQNTQYALNHTQNDNKNSKAKAQQAASLNLSLEGKQKESLEKLEKLEGTCYELRHEHEQQQLQFQQRLQQLQQQLSQQHQRSINDMDNKMKLLEQENTQLHNNNKKEVVKNVTHASSSPIKMTNGCGEVDGEKLVVLEKEKEDLVVKLQVKEKKNEDLRQKNWKVMEVLTERERRLEMVEVEKAELLSRHEKQLKELQTQLQATTTNNTTNHPSTTTTTKPHHTSTSNDVVKVGSKVGEDGCVLDPEIDNVKELKLVAKANNFCMQSQEDEINRLQQLLQLQTNKNDDLRKKNWAIMTSLTEYEGKVESLTHQLSSTLPPSSSSAPQSEVTVVKKVTEACEWDMGEIAGVLEKKEAELVIMQSLLDQNEESYQTLKEENDKLKSSSTTTHTITHPSTTNDEEMMMMTKEVELYKKVLTDTESTLQKLEANIDVREDGWKRQNEALKEKLQQLTNQS